MEIQAKVYVIAKKMELIKAALTELGYPDTETVFASPKPINVHEYIVERLKEKWFFFSEGAYWYQQDRLHRSGTVLNNNGAVIIHITSPDSDMVNEYWWVSPYGEVCNYFMDVDYSNYKNSYTQSRDKFLDELSDTFINGEIITEIFTYAEVHTDRYGYMEPISSSSKLSDILKNKSFDEYRAEMEKACKDGKSLQDMIEAVRKTIYEDMDEDNLFELAVRTLDKDAKVTFFDKHFALSGFRLTNYGQGVMKEIAKRGGIIHSSMVKMADYLIVCLECPGEAKIAKALEWRQKGASNLIVSDYQMWQALQEIPAMTDQELRLLSEKRRQQEILVEEEKLVAKQREEDYKLARRAEKIAAIKAAEEQKQQRAQRRADAAEQKRLVAQLKIKKEAEKQEARRAADEAKKKKQEALDEARANAIIMYAPGKEPEKLHNRIQALMTKLDEAYPDHVIVNLSRDHKNWGETIGELYRLLGYADNVSFLEAYGFKIDTGKGGRPTTLNPEAVIEELKHRYPEGTTLLMSELMAENKDLPIKNLYNNATKLFGMGLGKYLKLIGVTKKEET